MSLQPAPALDPPSLYVEVGRNGAKAHVAASPYAARTECGRVLPRRAWGQRIPPGSAYLDAVCRSCAGRHLNLAQALGLFSA